MPDATVRRTLVKSPPELWAELSDVTALARHLGEFGEVRITRTDPETTVAWEGDRACGTVEIEPSGWGTKVTLTATAVQPALPETAHAADDAPAEPEPEPEGTATATEETAAPEAETAPWEEPEREVRATPTPELEPAPRATSAPEPPRPRRGFFARLFGRRSAPEPPASGAGDAPDEPAAVAVPEDVEPEVVVVTPAEAEPRPEPEPPSEPATDDAVDEHRAVTTEPMSGERAEEILAAVLDDLGAAHHRPFSRS